MTPRAATIVGVVQIVGYITWRFRVAEREVGSAKRSPSGSSSWGGSDCCIGFPPNRSICRRDRMERKFKTLDELGHEREIESIDRVAGKVVVRISEESCVRDHDRWQACIPKRGVIAQARFGQHPPVEGQEQGIALARIGSRESPSEPPIQSAATASCQ